MNAVEWSNPISRQESLQSDFKSQGSQNPNEFQDLINDEMADMQHDPSKKLLFDFLSNDQHGKLISSAFSYASILEDYGEQNQPGGPHNARMGNPVTSDWFLGIDEQTTLNE